jgi:hypothetical protein
VPLSRRTALLALPLLLAACSGGEPGAPAPPSISAPTPTPTPTPVDPRPRLALAAKELARTSYKIAKTGTDGNSVWQVHGPSKSFKATPSGAPGGSIQIGGDAWTTAVIAGGVSAGVPGGGTRWIKLPKSAVAPMPDVVAARLVVAATGLGEAAPGTFTGSVPEQVCRDVVLFTADVVEPVVTGQRPAVVEWAETGTITIRLDERGRFAGLADEVPSADGSTAKKVAMTFSDYGKVGRPARPKNAIEMPSLPR